MADRPILFSGPMVRALLAGTKTQTRRILKPQPKQFPIDDKGTLCEVGVIHVEGDALPRIHHGRVITAQKLKCAVGDRLWVRENAAVRCTGWHHRDGHWHQVDYAADYNSSGQWIGTPGAGSSVRQGKAPTHFPSTSHTKSGRLRWTPGIHVPRWASRLTLTVTDVRVERVKDCSEEDAFAEGIETDVWDQAPAARNYGEDDAWLVGWPMGILSPCVSVERDEVCRRSYATLWDKINGPGSWEANPWVAAYTFTVRQGNIDAPA